MTVLGALTGAELALAQPVTPVEIGVQIEQLPHTTSVMISTIFAERGVRASLGLVSFDGEDYVVDVDFSGGGSPGREGHLVWTTIGRPEVGTYRLSVRHRGSGDILVTQKFQILPVGSLPATPDLSLELQPKLGTYVFDSLGPEIYPYVRAIAPASSSHNPGSLDYYPLFWSFRITNESSQSLAGATLDLQAPKGLRLDPSTFTVGALAPGDQAVFETAVTGSGASAGQLFVTYALTSTSAGGATTASSGEIPVAIMKYDNRGAPGADLVQIEGETALNIRPENYSFAWTLSEHDFAGAVGEVLPTLFQFEMDGLNIPPEELQGNVGVPTVIVASVGGAVVGGAGKATYDLVSEGETSVRGVLAGAAAGAVVADIGPALKVGKAIFKGTKAVGGWIKGLFSGPELLELRGSSLVYEDLYLPEGEIRVTTLDGELETFEFTGRGDPIPGSRLGSNVVLVSKQARPHFASCASGPDLRLSRSEVEAAARSWARGESRDGCGLPTREDLAEAARAWSGGGQAARVGAFPAAFGRPSGAIEGSSELSVTTTHPGATFVLTQRLWAERRTEGVFLDLDLPEGWLAAPLLRSGSYFRRGENTFFWPVLEQGETVVMLKVHAPDRSVQGRHGLGGTLYSIGGSEARMTPVSVAIEGSPPFIPIRR